MVKARKLTALSLILFSASRAAAQAPPAQPRPTTPTGPGAALEEPRLPEVDDPMLTPLAPAPNVLGSWQQAVAMTRRQSTGLRIAAAQADQARAASRQALARALPTLVGRGTVTQHLLRNEVTVPGFEVRQFNPVVLQPTTTTTNTPDPSRAWLATLTLDVPVFAPSAWYDHGTAKDFEHQQRLNEKEVKRQVLASVAEAIVSVVTAERLAEVSRVSLRSALSTLELTKRRARLGAGTALDVVRTEQEVTLTRSQVVTNDESVRRAREALGLALGTAEPWGVTPAIRLDALAADARSSCRPERDVNLRPDVMTAQAAVGVAERKVTSIDWQYWPTVDFFSTLTYLSNELASPNFTHFTWTIGGVLNWTLYDGGVREGTRDFNQQGAIIAHEQLTQTRRQAKIEVVQAIRGVEVAEANLKVSARTQELAQESVRLSRIAYANGTGTSFDLVDTGRRLREAELDLAIKEFEVVRAKVAALLALATCDV